MEKTKLGVNYKATEDFIDQLRSFIIERYKEIYNYNPLDDALVLKSFESKEGEYECLLNMLDACYENDNCPYYEHCGI